MVGEVPPNGSAFSTRRTCRGGAATNLGGPAGKAIRWRRLFRFCRLGRNGNPQAEREKRCGRPEIVTYVWLERLPAAATKSLQLDAWN